MTVQNALQNQDENWGTPIGDHAERKSIDPEDMLHHELSCLLD
jgi:hypothetical protein